MNKEYFIDFRFRETKPNVPHAGTFYWVSNPNDGNQIYFAPTDEGKDLICLNETFTERFEGIETNISDILKDYVTDSNLKTKLKTINGESIVGEGNISTEVELNGETFNKLVDSVIPQIDVRPLSWINI